AKVDDAAVQKQPAAQAATSAKANSTNKTRSTKTGAANKTAVGAEAGVTITVTEKKPSQSSAPKKNIRTKKTPLAKVVASETSETSAGSSATKRKDRKSTRLNSSHVKSSYAVFCLKKST